MHSSFAFAPSLAVPCSHGVRCASFLSSISHRQEKAPCNARRRPCSPSFSPVMLARPTERRPGDRRPRGGKKGGLTDPEDVLARARDTWNDATSAERWTFIATAGVATFAASSALHAVFSVLSLLIFSVFALPLFALAASLGVVAFATTFAGFAVFSVFGAVGFGFVGLPLLLTGTLVFKLIGPVALTLPVLAWKRSQDARRVKDEADATFLVDDDVGEGSETADTPDEFDDLLSFDRQLRRRAPVSSMDVDTMTKEDILAWSVDDTLMFLRFADLASAVPVFKAERIDGHALNTMDDSELRGITQSLPLGDRKRLVALVHRFRTLR